MATQKYREIVCMSFTVMDTVKVQQKIAEKLHLAPNGQCLLWGGTRKKCRGIYYGVLNVKVGKKWRTLYVHRLALMLEMGWSLDDMDGEGLDVSHLCHQPLCGNARHLSYELHYVNRDRSRCVERGECFGHGQFEDCILNL